MQTVQGEIVVHTFKGKYIGNQLIMPSLLASMVLGFVESSTPRYRTVSKYPARPWHVPRLETANVSVVLRAL